MSLGIDFRFGLIDGRSCARSGNVQAAICLDSKTHVDGFSIERILFFETGLIGDGGARAATVYRAKFQSRHAISPSNIGLLVSALMIALALQRRFLFILHILPSVFLCATLALFPICYFHHFGCFCC